MKRALQEKPTSSSAGRVEFVLSTRERREPLEVKDMEKTYKGCVHVLACEKQSQLKSCFVQMTNDNLISCCPHFVYSTTSAGYEANASALTVCKDDTYLCKVDRMKPYIGQEDVAYLAQEITHALPDGMQALVLELVARCARLQVPNEIVCEMPFYKNPGGMLYETSDMYRLPFLQHVYPYMVTSKYSIKQHKQLRSLNTQHILEIDIVLSTTPWELVWPVTAKRYKLKSITRDAYARALKEHNLEHVVPVHVKFAVNMFFHMSDARENDKHTVFRKSSYDTMIPCMRIEERQELMRQIYTYLSEKAIAVFTSTSGLEMVALKDDYEAAESACDSLTSIHTRSKERNFEPERRDLLVPQIPPQLTPRQTEIANHILNNWLTIVEGLPGTGKTALITWVFSHYKRVMMMSFVGMMVKSLQKRNGRRKEVACTIHHLLAMRKYGNKDHVDAWLKHFEVIVIDEFSNVSMGLFHKVLRLFPNVSKLVLVGDHRQLKPIDCGDPMGDLLTAFGSHLLIDNLRVVPGLQALQDAPRLITEGRARNIDFNPSGPISFVAQPAANYADALLPIFKNILTRKNGKSILNTHIVALTNQARKSLNYASEYVWLKLNILKRPYDGGVEIRPKFFLYKGCKITFLKNYNHPLKIGAKTTEDEMTDDEPDNSSMSQPVANGELAIVVSIEKMPTSIGGFKLVIVDSEDPSDEPERKVVWIHAENGVHPFHIDMGYATTTYKSQGREFAYVLFWNKTDPREHWTRPNAYVAISRGKERVWIASEPVDFFTVCAQLDVKRKTVFSEMLSLKLSGKEYREPIDAYKPGPIISDLKTLKEDKEKGKPCVLTLACVRKKMQSKKKN